MSETLILSLGLILFGVATFFCMAWAQRPAKGPKTKVMVDLVFNPPCDEALFERIEALELELEKEIKAA